MARGHVYEILTDADMIGCLGAGCLDDDLGWLCADYAVNTDGKQGEHLKKDITARMEKHGFSVGREEGVFYFSFTKENRISWFRERLKTLKSKVEKLTEEEFAGPFFDAYGLTRLIRDDYSDCVYADCVYDDGGCVLYFDDFLREAEEGTTYYMGNVVLLH